MPAGTNTHAEKIVDKNGKVTTVYKGRATPAAATPRIDSVKAPPVSPTTRNGVILVSFEDSIVMQLEDITANLDADQSGSFTHDELYGRVMGIGDFTADALVICLETIDGIFAKGNPNRRVSSYTLNTKLKKKLKELQAA